MFLRPLKYRTLRGMKRKELEHIVQKYAKHVQQYSQQLPGTFAVEDIHELRVEYKKLRAFIRLVQLDEAAGKHLAMPEKVKALYRAAGSVRDLQLFQGASQKIITEKEGGLPHFNKSLDKKLFAAKENAVEEVERFEGRRAFTPITDALPDYLHDNTIRQFILRKVAAIRIIQLALERDEELHSVRKHLKDIFYVIRIFENDWGISFPVVAWRNEKQLGDVAAALGDFNDCCNTVALVQQSLHGSLPSEEETVLAEWRDKLLLEKENAQRAMIQQVQELEFTV